MMLDNKQEQHSGDKSVNIQAEQIYYGLTYSEARQSALDVFESNFYKLSDKAAEIAFSRAKNLIDQVISKIESTGAKEIQEAKNPDFQFALYEAQKEFARSGDSDLGALLVQLLVDRSNIHEKSLLQIVLNESMKTAPKLTQNQLNALSLIFLIKYTQHNGILDISSLESYFDKYILPFCSDLPEKVSAYQHLEFAGCGNISLASKSIVDIWKIHFSAFFSKGFSIEDINASSLSFLEVRPLLIPCIHEPERYQIKTLNEAVLKDFDDFKKLDTGIQEKIKALINSNSFSNQEIVDFLVSHRTGLQTLFDRWSSTPIQQMTLTSVGIAIAHANIQRQTGESFDLSIWI